MNNETKPKTQYCYSTMCDEFTGQCDSREEALEMALEEVDWHDEYVQTARIIPMVKYLEGRTGIGADVLESLCDNVASDMMSEEPVFSVTEEQADELTHVILEWVAKNAKELRYGVESPQSHKIHTEGESA